MKKWLKLQWVVCCAAVTAGCGVGDGFDADGEPTRARSLGVLSLVVSQNVADAEDALDDGRTVLDASAHFVRFSAIGDADVFRLLALPSDPVPALPIVGQCAVTSLQLASAEDALLLDTTLDAASVTLLEAGRVDISVDEGRVELESSYVPGLLPFVSGVVYDEARLTGLAAPRAVFARSAGSEAVGAFTVAAVSPEVPRLDVIAPGVADGVPLRRGDPLTLRWSSPPGDGPAATTYVALASADGDADRVLRCRLDDSGGFVIPADAIIALTDGERDLRLSLSLIRTLRRSFHAEGLDHAELRLTVRATTADIQLD